MNNLAISTHNFDNAKLEIKKFSQKIPAEVEISHVDEEKDLFEFGCDLLLGRGLGISHKVTGKEFNELTTQIQKHLIGIRTTQIDLIKQFKNVYDALEALDKDYIRYILISIKATEKTSESIKKK